MDELKDLLHWILGGIVGLLAWIGKRQIARIDALEAQFVSRQELLERLKARDEMAQERHRENKETLSYIRDRLDSLYERE